MAAHIKAGIIDACNILIKGRFIRKRKRRLIGGYPCHFEERIIIRDHIIPHTVILRHATGRGKIERFYDLPAAGHDFPAGVIYYGSCNVSMFLPVVHLIIGTVIHMRSVLRILTLQKLTVGIASRADRLCLQCLRLIIGRHLTRHHLVEVIFDRHIIDHHKALRITAHLKTALISVGDPAAERIRKIHLISIHGIDTHIAIPRLRKT